MLRALLFGVLRLLVRIAEAIYQGEGVATLMLLLPTQMMAATFRIYGATIGNNVRFRSPLIVHNTAVHSERAYFANLIVGDQCYFGKDVFLDLQDRIVLEERVTVSMRVTILTHTDVGNSTLRETVLPPTQAPVIIRADAYIGAGVTILQGIEIGEGTVVGAGAVVTESIPAHSVAVGVPARVVKHLNDFTYRLSETVVS
jgi:acetyltransferase-like isoleucine patch superfamily enzyme